jgi:hypothetical protein
MYPIALVLVSPRMFLVLYLHNGCGRYASAREKKKKHVLLPFSISVHSETQLATVKVLLSINCGRSRVPYVRNIREWMKFGVRNQLERPMSLEQTFLVSRPCTLLYFFFFFSLSPFDRNKVFIITHIKRVNVGRRVCTLEI